MTAAFHQNSNDPPDPIAMTVNVTGAYETKHHALLRIRGEARHEFLQGQLTQDIDSLDARHSVMAGWTTAKGRLLFVSQLVDWNGDIYLPVSSDIAEKLLARLGMFILRSDVRIDIAPELELAGLATEGTDPVNVNGLEVPAEPGASVSSDTLCVARVIGDAARLWILGTRETISGIRKTTPTSFSSNDWTLRNIHAGIPEINSETSEMFIPQMLNLDLLGAVSFTKGCYVGQEIVARTQNLGRIKRRMYRFRSESGNQLSSGAMLYGPDGATGKIVSSVPDGHSAELLAVIAIDLADGNWYTDEGQHLRIEQRPLPYAITQSA